MNSFGLFLGLVLTLLFAGCQGSNSESIAKKSDVVLPEFKGFPDSLFLGLYWNQPMSLVKESLQKKSFDLIDSSGNWRFFNEKDSIEIILPFSNALTSLKVYLKSRRFINNKEELQLILSKENSNIEQEANFKVFNYFNLNKPFKLSYFELENGIKLNYELTNKK